jgi:hypothetical protein
MCLRCDLAEGDEKHQVDDVRARSRLPAKLGREARTPFWRRTAKEGGSAEGKGHGSSLASAPRLSKKALSPTPVSGIWALP